MNSSKSASISTCGTYRWVLTRSRFESAVKPMVFLMLNPSTANSFTDDPTIRRCNSFAQREGYDGIVVVNLYAARATDPNQLRKFVNPVGLLNDYHIMKAARKSNEVVCAWGSNPGPQKERQFEVTHMLAQAGVECLCLGTTKDGSPRHPLYVRSDQPLVGYWP